MVLHLLARDHGHGLGRFSQRHARLGRHAAVRRLVAVHLTQCVSQREALDHHGLELHGSGLLASRHQGIGPALVTDRLQTAAAQQGLKALIHAVLALQTAGVAAVHEAAIDGQHHPRLARETAQCAGQGTGWDVIAPCSLLSRRLRQSHRSGGNRRQRQTEQRGADGPRQWVGAAGRQGIGAHDSSFLRRQIRDRCGYAQRAKRKGNHPTKYFCSGSTSVAMPAPGLPTRAAGDSRAGTACWQRHPALGRYRPEGRHRRHASRQSEDRNPSSPADSAPIH